MAHIAEITLRCHGAPRLTAGFAGWTAEERDGVTVLRRRDATAAEVHEAFDEAGELGLEIESFRRLEPA
ncbi:MAG: hypothetical protein C0P77_005015 [Thermoanaerobacterales bacterium]|nr:hypothetical protein [Thermoanaerobacterales bacterium]